MNPEKEGRTFAESKLNLKQTEFVQTLVRPRAPVKKNPCRMLTKGSSKSPTVSISIQILVCANVILG